MDLSGYLTDMNGNPVGITSNPLVISFSTTAPQTFHFSEPTVIEVEKIVYLENLNRLRPPKSFTERIWQNIGKYMKWV
jgi:hypothetical protein